MVINDSYSKMIHRLDSKVNHKGTYFRLQKLLQYASHDLERDISKLSFSKILCELSIFSWALAQFPKAPDQETFDRRVQFYSVTPNALLGMIQQKCARLVRKNQFLRANGIDPQAKALGAERHLDEVK